MNKFFFLIAFTLLLLSGCAKAEKGIDETNVIDNKEVMIQKLIDETHLNLYFHENTFPDRVPLIIVSNGFFEDHKILSKFNQGVIVYKDKNMVPEGKSYLEITKYESKKDTARIGFLYPPEGIRGTVEFKIDDKGVSVVNQRLVEM